jgi:hypothetical protein
MDPCASLPALAHRHDGNSSDDAEILRLLLIEDSRVDACVIQVYLASTDDGRVELEHADRLSSGLSRLKEGHFHRAVQEFCDPKKALDDLTAMVNKVA